MSLVHTPAQLLGTQIRELRERSGRTQKSLAQQLGISQSALSAWESGTTLPPRHHLAKIAEALGTKARELEDALEWAETAHSHAPMSVERIHFQAAEHVKRYGSDNLAIWILGATNLSVMEAPFVRERWRANLLRGVSYNLVWLLDLVREESFRAAITVLADIKAQAQADHRARGGVGPFGEIVHYASDGYQVPSEAMLALYHQLVEAPDNLPGKMRAHRFRSSLKADGARAMALREAVIRLLKCWNPETGIVFYRPKTITTPPVANVRLMAVTEQIVEGLSREAETPSYWFWLSPNGAARLNTAVTVFERAILGEP